MPRLVNSVSGVVVSVDEATAANLGADWSEAKAEADDKPARRVRN